MVSKLPLIGCILVGLTACLGNGITLPPEPKPGDRNAKRVDYSFDVATASQWRRSAFYRTEDEGMRFPVFVAVAIDGTGCFIPAPVWATLQHGHMVGCAGLWRVARGI